MADATNDFIVEMLRTIQADVADIKADVWDIEADVRDPKIEPSHS